MSLNSINRYKVPDFDNKNYLCIWRHKANPDSSVLRFNSRVLRCRKVVFSIIDNMCLRWWSITSFYRVMCSLPYASLTASSQKPPLINFSTSLWPSKKSARSSVKHLVVNHTPFRSHQYSKNLRLRVQLITCTSI